MKIKKRLRLIKKSHKVIRKKLKKGQFIRNGTKEIAHYLRFHTPASEKWFQRKWKESGMQNHHDLFNWPFENLIPDCINHKYKYVIEVDGSVHLNDGNRERDRKKDLFYHSKGYMVFRVIAFDQNSFDKLRPYFARY